MDWKDEDSFPSSVSTVFNELTFSISKRYVHRKSKDKNPYNLSAYSDENGIEFYSKSFNSVDECKAEAEFLINSLTNDRLMVFRPDDESDIAVPCVVVLSGEGHICILDTPEANNNMMCELVDFASELAKRYANANANN